MRFSCGFLLGFVAVAVFCAPVSAAPDRAEITYWESVRDSKTPAELEAYLKTYPDGAFAPLARIRLKALQGAEKKSDAATENSGSGNPDVDTENGRTKVTDGAENLTLTARLAKKEIDGVPRTMLGVNISDLTKYQTSCFRVPEATGVLVQNVVADSPASQAGIVSGDIIREFEGKPVKTARGLVELVSAQPAGVSTKVGVLRPRALKDGAKVLADRAATGDGDAMLCFAFVQMNGLGTQKSLAEANRWYRKAAEAGVTDAMYNLANHLENGTGIAKDIADANRWYRKAAEAGNANAMVGLAFNLQSGNGITKDAAEANRWYRKAAEAGNVTAMHNLATHLAIGVGGARDDAAATQWYRKAAELGKTESMIGLGWLSKDEAEAVRWYRRAADLGHGGAMNLLAGALQEGRGTAKDEAEALRWYRKAAGNGIGAAMSAISAGYDQGTMGLQKDPKLGAEWLFKGIEAGDEYAPVRLTQNPDLYSRQLRREFQRLLQEAGHYTGDVDGSIGQGTKSAVMALRDSGAKKRQAATQTAVTSSPSAPAAPLPDFGNVKDLDTLE